MAIGSLLLIATSSLAQPLAPAVPLTNTRYSTAGEAAVASLATNGRTFVAAWRTPTSVRVSRIDGAHASIGVPTGGVAAEAPAIAAYGDRFVLADGGSLRFLDGNGNPTNSIPLGTTFSSARIASNGAAVMVAYPRQSFPYDILGAFVAPTGEVLQRDVKIGTNTLLTSPLPFSIAADQNGFAFISEDGGDIVVKMFDPEGNLRRMATLDGPSAVPRFTAVAGDGRTFLFIWSDEDRALRAVQFRSDTNFIGKFTVLPPRPGHAPAQPSLAFDGQSFVCSYLDGDEVDMIRIAPVEQTVSAPVMLATGASSGPSVAAANGVALTAWSRATAPLNDLGAGGLALARSVDANGTFGETFAVSVAAHDQTRSAAATNGTDTLVTWIEGDDQEVSLMGGLLRADGTWREIGALGRGGSTAPLVASDGHDFLVIGADGALRVFADGTIVGGGAPASLGRLSATGLTWSGHDYVAVGEIDRGSPTSPGLGALSISASGAVGPLHVIRPPVDGDTAERPSIASSGDGFLVTFVADEPPFFFFFPVPGGNAARAVRLSAALDRVGPEIEIVPTDAVVATGVAWNGNEYLAVAADDKVLDSLRIARDGSVIGAIKRLNADELVRLGTPSVTAVGEDFFVAWREAGSGGVVTGGGFVCIARADGTAGAPVAFPGGSRSTADPVLVAGGNGVHLIRPSFIDDAPYFGAERVIIQEVNTGDMLPEPPSLDVRSTSDGAILAWSGAPGANGYRIEYRNARHDWEEVETWQLPDARTFSVVFDRGDIYQFRVKAIGWGGAAYSNVALFDPTRRRAVR